MNLTSFWRAFLIALMSVLVLACKPQPDFSVSPTSLIAGQLATFDATASVITDTAAKKEVQNTNQKDDKKKPKKTISYSWDFGDGSTATGIIATHAFASQGSYKVTLTIIDRDGEIGTISKTLQVSPSSDALSQLNVQVQGMDSVLISGATITIGTATATTDAQGLSTISAASGTQVVKVTKPGYITQVVRSTLQADKTANLRLVMMPIKETLSVNLDMTKPQLINAKTLGASILLPANALVVPGVNGAPDVAATGMVTLQLTPWDVAGSDRYKIPGAGKDLYAMPGYGKALAADGSIVNLISAGMMTVDFYNAAGQHLQLASGKTADIQMDLPYASINGIPLTQESTIPLWTFDESKGLWVHEGTGKVVASSLVSPTGLAVKATVSHFSTWNWDFAVTNPTGGATNNITVFCVDNTNQKLACAITADVTLPDGSKYYEHGNTSNSSSAGVEGLTIYSVPANASIVWSGTTAGGLTGTATGSTGIINVVMGAPKTDNFVQCKIAGAPVACDVDLVITTGTGSKVASTYYVPAEGSSIKTSVVTTSPLVWTGKSRKTLFNDQWVRYEGTMSTGTSGSVVLDLTKMIVLPTKTVYLSCDPKADLVNSEGSVSSIGVSGEFALDQCVISISRYDSTNPSNNFYNAISNVPTGTLVAMQLPVMDDLATISIDAYGEVFAAGDMHAVFAYKTINYGGLSNNQSLPLRLATQATPATAYSFKKSSAK